MPLSVVLRPRLWGIHLLALVLVAAAGWLGVWQVQAWQAARDAEARDLTLAEPLPLADVLGPDDPFPAAYVGQPVLLAGEWLPESTLFVSGRRHEGADGYWVVTPLVVAGTEGAAGAEGAAMMVVRGWSPSIQDAPPPPTGEADLVGRLQPGEGTGVMDDDPSDNVLPQLRIADAIQHVDQDLFGGYAVVTGETARAAGLEPATLDQLPEVGRFTSVRNLLYGIEWWIFGLFAAFIWWRWVRDEVLA
ncbi:SURF1 family protein, partial [Nocardioides sp.]|uniref:SURF1 family protein n=1 Tax=Nocardioides sp. TaxID=35761 RepID=UPI0027375559